MSKFPRSVIAVLVFSAGGFAVMSSHESYTGTAAQPLPGDKWTYGLGSTTRPDGQPVQPTDKITPPKAIQLAVRDVAVKEAVLKRCINAPLYQHEYDALVSLAYNVGPAAVCESSIPRKLASGDYAAACATILEFDKFRDCNKPRIFSQKKQVWECPLVKIKGLTIRRQAEYRQCMGQKP